MPETTLTRSFSKSHSRTCADAGLQGTARPKCYALLDYFLQGEKSKLTFVDAGAGEGHAVNTAGVMGFAEVFGVEIGDYHLNQESKWDCLSKRAVAQIDKKKPQVLWRTACNANFRLSQLWQANSKQRCVAVYSFWHGWKSEDKQHLLRLLEKDKQVYYAFLIDRVSCLRDCDAIDLLVSFKLTCHAPVQMAGERGETFRLFVFSRQRSPAPTLSLHVCLYAVYSCMYACNTLRNHCVHV